MWRWEGGHVFPAQDGVARGTIDVGHRVDARDEETLLLWSPRHIHPAPPPPPAVPEIPPRTGTRATRGDVQALSPHQNITASAASRPKWFCSNAGATLVGLSLGLQVG